MPPQVPSIPCSLPPRASSIPCSLPLVFLFNVLSAWCSYSTRPLCMVFLFNAPSLVFLFNAPSLVFFLNAPSLHGVLIQHAGRPLWRTSCVLPQRALSGVLPVFFLNAPSSPSSLLSALACSYPRSFLSSLAPLLPRSSPLCRTARR